MNEFNDIIVAIHCFAYNHEPYIRECLEGFVMQKTNFRFVAIVHDDASTDKTADIIREYEAKYPEIIKPIYETENQYSKRDGTIDRIMDEAIAATGAKYIAMCEGDDYWTDPLKLQKQVDFLEEHEDYVMCYTDYNTIDENSSFIEWKNHSINIGRSYSGDIFKELLKGNYIQTPTVVFRKEIVDDPKYVGGLDYAWLMQCALYGNCHFLKERTSCYRLQKNSAIHTRLEQISQISIKIWEYYVDRYFDTPSCRRHFFEHIRICAAIDYVIISKYRSGGENKIQSKRVLDKHPVLYVYYCLGLLYKLRHRMSKLVER